MRIGFDFDGVLCPTPFGRFAVHEPQPVPPLPDNFEALYAARDEPHFLRAALEFMRFAWRMSAPSATDVLRQLADAHDLFIVTARSDDGIGILRRWLRRHKIDGYFKEICMSPPGVTSPQHKLAGAHLLSLDAHIDDDPRTAFHLARETSMSVYLLDHANARGDEPLPPNLTVVTSLDDFAAKVAAAATSP
jgi:phosphoglycolate phosphatase-like HAD superfamily hydrolase